MGTPQDYVVTDDEDQLKKAAIEDPIITSLNNASQHLENNSRLPGSDLRVLSLAYARTRVDVYEDVYNYLNNKKHGIPYIESWKNTLTGNWRHFVTPKLRKAIFGSVGGGTPTENYQKVVDYVDKHLDNNPAVEASLSRYRSATKALVDKANINLVTGTGNSNFVSGSDKFPEGVEVEKIKFKPGAGYNYLAMSDDVIAVAATNTQLTVGPGWQRDDSITSFSSRGFGETPRPEDGKLWNPTVALPGENVYVREGFISGTSPATTQMSAEIALKIDAERKYGRGEITAREILQEIPKAAIKLRGYHISGQGHGALDASRFIPLPPGTENPFTPVQPEPAPGGAPPIYRKMYR